MLKIHCPVCKKSFFWTDDMPVEGKCKNPDCQWHYDIHSALKQNISNHHPDTAEVWGKILQCPSCKGKIPFRYTVCPHCNNIVANTRIIKKTHFFMAICVILIILSLILKYLG